ncbi:MAG: ABC transporter permease, partial [Rhodobacterales bacterium]|nr:ABC transporter permease [Rhodobacterales bacterium]
MASLSDTPNDRQLPRFWLEADPTQKLAMVVGAILVLLAALTPLIAPFDPNAQSLIARLRPPVWMERGQPGYLLGTDEL